MRDHDQFRKERDERRNIVPAKEAARFLSKNPNTLTKWRMSGTGPRFLKVGRSVCYRLSDISAWLEDHSFDSTAQYQTRAISRKSRTA